MLQANYLLLTHKPATGIKKYLRHYTLIVQAISDLKKFSGDLQPMGITSVQELLLVIHLTCQLYFFLN